MAQPQPTRTRADRPDIWVGDDATIRGYADGISTYPVDLYIAVTDSDESVGALHLSPTAARKVRDALTLVLVEIEVAALKLAGLGVEAPVARSFGEALTVDIPVTDFRFSQTEAADYLKDLS